MESTTSTGVRPSGLQPKFKDCSFDSDKNPGYFLVWIKLISGIVRNLPGGAELEAFLDCYLLGGKWKLEFISKAREIFASKVTIEHYIMQCAFRSRRNLTTQ